MKKTQPEFIVTKVCRDTNDYFPKDPVMARMMGNTPMKKRERGIQALYVVRSPDNEDLYGPEDFKSCAEEARRLSMCTGKMHKVVRV